MIRDITSVTISNSVNKVNGILICRIEKILGIETDIESCRRKEWLPWDYDPFEPLLKSNPLGTKVFT